MGFFSKEEDNKKTSPILQVRMKCKRRESSILLKISDLGTSKTSSRNVPLCYYTDLWRLKGFPSKFETLRLRKSFRIRESSLKNRLLLLCHHVIVWGSRDQCSINFRIYSLLIFPRYNTPLLKISNVLKVKPELLGRSHHVFIWVQMNLFKPFRTVRCPKLPASYTGYNLTVYIRFSRKVRYTGTKRIVNSCLRMKYSLKTS